MTVYVDDMRAPYRGMVMCHMLADSDAELLAMADRIGVARKWHQHPGTYRSHFDICLSKKALVLAAGGKQITQRQAATIRMQRLQLLRAAGGAHFGHQQHQEAPRGARA